MNLALWPAEVGRIYRILGMVGEGCPGHGPLHLLSASAAEIVFFWDPGILAWVRPGLPLLSNLAGPFQHFKAAILEAWRDKVSVDLCGRKGFRGGPLLDVHGSLHLLNSSHVRERDKALLRGIMVGGVWNGFLLVRVRSQVVPCRFCGAPDDDGHLFGECTFPPLVEIRENPEFHDLMREDKAHWPRCLLRHGWLPMLSGVNGASPWAVDASESAAYLVETSLGQYSSRLVSDWTLPDGFDADEVSAHMPDSPDIWSDGSLVMDSVTGISAAGAGMFAHYSEACWSGRRWGHVDRVQSVGLDHSCRAFISVPGPLQTVQRAELWGVILALQSDRAVHVGVDAANEAADFGRRRVSPAVIDARRNLSGVCNRWYPVVLDLRRFFIAISRAVVNHDGFAGIAPDPLVWSAGSLPKRRRLVHAVRDLALLPGPPGIWLGEWVAGPVVAVDADDVAQWPYTPGLLVKWVSFLNSLHWPVGNMDLGVGGISYVELLILYELWAGERLRLEKAHPRYLRLGRPISVSAVPSGPGIDIWRSCRFIGALMRALCLLPGGLGRFVPCSIGANHCRLRHVGWEKCGHGLSSRPRESASELFLNELLTLFRYLSKSGRALHGGTLPLRYCAARFFYRFLVMLIA